MTILNIVGGISGYVYQTFTFAFNLFMAWISAPLWLFLPIKMMQEIKSRAFKENSGELNLSSQLLVAKLKSNSSIPLQQSHILHLKKNKKRWNVGTSLHGRSFYDFLCVGDCSSPNKWFCNDSISSHFGNSEKKKRTIPNWFQNLKNFTRVGFRLRK